MRKVWANLKEAWRRNLLIFGEKDLQQPYASYPWEDISDEWMTEDKKQQYLRWIARAVIGK